MNVLKVIMFGIGLNFEYLVWSIVLFHIFFNLFYIGFLFLNGKSLRSLTNYDKIKISFALSIIIIIVIIQSNNDFLGMFSFFQTSIAVLSFIFTIFSTFLILNYFKLVNIVLDIKLKEIFKSLFISLIIISSLLVLLFQDIESNPDDIGLTAPISEYSHFDTELGLDGYSSITGGYVYRGELLPSLYGKYVFSDYISNRVWAMDPENPSEYQTLIDFSEEIYAPNNTARVVSFYENNELELLFVGIHSGKMYILNMVEGNNYVAEDLYPEISFVEPTCISSPNHEGNNYYVTEKGGKLFKIVEANETASTELILDISDIVMQSPASAGGIGGLRSLAFHPNFSNNSIFYLTYILNDRSLVLSSFSMMDNSTEIKKTGKIIMIVEQDSLYHSGGHILFGPDNLLYFGLGDDGKIDDGPNTPTGDPHGNGQDLTTVKGSIIRIEVGPNIETYRIPSDNPFHSHGPEVRKEIFAYGLRNSWRFSFDSLTGDLWAGDVGATSYEEINLIEAGNNYGWALREGSSCYKSTDIIYDKHYCDIKDEFAFTSFSVGQSFFALAVSFLLLGILGMTSVTQEKDNAAIKFFFSITFLTVFVYLTVVFFPRESVYFDATDMLMISLSNFVGLFSVLIIEYKYNIRAYIL